MAAKKRLKDLSGTQKIRIAIMAAAQLALQGAAVKDLLRRPAAQVNGPKVAWFAVSFLNFIGPIAYFLFGRRK